MTAHLALTLAEVWGVVTIALIALSIHRGILSTREEDQVFLDPAEQSLAADQASVIERMKRLAMPIRLLYVLSGGLLVASVVAWIWQGLGL